EGVNYGGTQPAVQTRFMMTEVAPILRRPYRKVLFLDFHTGLGDAGVLAIIRGLAPRSDLMREVEVLFAGRERDGVGIRSGTDSGYFQTLGDVIDFVPGLAPERPVLAVTMEFGTLGTDTLSQLRSAARIILENQAHFHGCTTPAICATVAQNFREMFNP